MNEKLDEAANPSPTHRPVIHGEHPSPHSRHPRAETTSRILDAAEDLFSRRDPDKVTIREIGDQAGVTHAVVHEYLGSKADIIAAVIARGAPQRQRLMIEHPDFFEGVPLVIETVLERRLHSRSIMRAAMDDREFDAIEDRIKSGEMLLDLIGKAIDQGALRPAQEDVIDPRVALAMSTALAFGWASMEDWLAKVYDLAGEDLEQLRERVVASCMGLATLALPPESEGPSDASALNRMSSTSGLGHDDTL